MRTQEIEPEQCEGLLNVPKLDFFSSPTAELSRDLLASSLRCSSMSACVCAPPSLSPPPPVIVGIEIIFLVFIAVLASNEQNENVCELKITFFSSSSSSFRSAPLYFMCPAICICVWRGKIGGDA